MPPPLLIPWRGTCYRHIPAGSPYGPLDSRFAGLARDNRWNRAGEPTMYFAGDPGTLVAEFGRHLSMNRHARLVDLVLPRRLFSFDIELRRVLDIRPLPVQRRLGLTGGSKRFLDRDVARGVATLARQSLRAEAMVAPSMAFLDDPDRWLLVLFLDGLTGDIDKSIRSIEDLGVLLVTES